MLIYVNPLTLYSMGGITKFSHFHRKNEYIIFIYQRFPFTTLHNVFDM